MKLTLFLMPLFFLILSAICTIADAKPPRLAPNIVCNETEFFFGSAPNTETISHDFIILNEGESPLHVSAVRADCGCVAARLGNNTLAPGKSAALKVKFDLKGRSGKQIRRIIVESNDQAQPRLVLVLIGEAIAPLEIVPDQLYWGNIHLNASVEKSCEIRFADGDESYINSIASSNPAFVAELLTVKPRRVYKVIVRSIPPLCPGSFQSTLRLPTDHPRFKTLEIPMQGRIVDDIYAIPEEIIIASPEKNKNECKISRALLVYSGLKKKFKILRVELPAPEMKSNIRSLAAGVGWRIDLRNIIPSRILDGASILIFTDSEAIPTLKVPIRVADPDDS
ncbi:MAG: DUF1573 domain-containing protein [Kiritimatiellia bacterium]|nr:DUF1573 domain-containing protein [Kiritimatiellia bacterium]